MSYVPMSSAIKAVLPNATTAGAAILDDADAAAQLATLGGGSKGIAIFQDTASGDVLTELGVSAFVQTTLDDANAAAFRTTVGAGVGLAVETKSADFTAADGALYEIDASGGAIAVTLPACDPNALMGFKVKVGGNSVTLTRAGADTIDGSNTFVIANVGEYYELYGNAAGDRWLVR